MLTALDEADDMKIKHTFVFEYEKGNEPVITKNTEFMGGKIVSVVFGIDCIEELDNAKEIIQSNGLDDDYAGIY